MKVDGQHCRGHEIVLLPEYEQPRIGDKVFYCQGCCKLFVAGEFENEWWSIDE